MRMEGGYPQRGDVGETPTNDVGAGSRAGMASGQSRPGRWILDLGPEGGDAGGRVVAEGTPEQVAQNKQSYTGEFLKKLLTRQLAPA